MKASNQSIVDFPVMYDLVLVITWIVKWLSHLPIFYNGNNRTQIDSKVVRNETIKPQCRPLIIIFKKNSRCNNAKKELEKANKWHLVSIATIPSAKATRAPKLPYSGPKKIVQSVKCTNPRRGM